MEDIETILNTLIYDGKVEMTIIAAKEGTVGCVDGQMKLYRGVNPIIQPTGLVKTPCGLCPVNAAVTPADNLKRQWTHSNIELKQIKMSLMSPQNSDLRQLEVPIFMI